MFQKSVIICLAAILCALSNVSCVGRASGGEQVLTVSIPPQRHLLEKIVGDKFRVNCMLEKGGSPETFEPSFSQMMELERSKAYFAIGHLPFEKIVGIRLSEIGHQPPVDTSDGIRLLEGHHHGDHSPLGESCGEIDPHIWMSPANMLVIARNMKDAVVSIDAQNRAFYEENYRRLADEIEGLRDSLSSRLMPVAGRAFLVWHPALSYFARDYHLEQVSLELAGKEAPMRFVESRLSEAKNLGAVVFLMQPNDSQQATSVTGQLDVRIVKMNPLAEDWMKELRHIAYELSK